MKKTYGLLSNDEQSLLNQLVEGMSKEQLLWVSGYLAGKSENSSTRVKPVKVPKIQVLYGTHSGNSEWIADELKQKGKDKGLDIKVSIMEKFDASKTAHLKNLLIIVSTHGEGEPPANAADYLDYLKDSETPQFPNLNYAVLGLGDKTFKNFSQAGIDFNFALQNKGAKPILPLRKCDASFVGDAKVWMDDIINYFTDEPKTKPTSLSLGKPLFASPSITPGFAMPSYKRIYDRNNPFYAKILKKQLLNGEGSNKEVYHFELSIRDSGFTYNPGDIVSVFSDNAPSLVDAIIVQGHYNANDEVVIDKQVHSLVGALKNHLEITVLSSKILQAYNTYAQSNALSALLNDVKQLNDFLYGSDLLDLMQLYPCSISAQELVSMLRPLPPRKYSIASSQNAFPNEVHLTISAVRFNKNNRAHQGACSGFVTDRVEEGDRIPVFIQKNKNFKLPDDIRTPLIMIGPGTGIAPFRGFVQERKHNGIKEGAWLFFGDQHKKTDFLYAEEWRSLKDEGYLNALDLAFSRDTAEKTYVQHRLLEKSAEVWQWLEKGAFVYVCGDKKRMATDVHLALLDIVRSEGRMDINAAKQYLNKLTAEKRYQKDVY